jgi:hypothetical protein
VHCGIRVAKFGTRWWLAVSPTNDFPGGNGATHPPNPNHVEGSMTVLAPGCGDRLDRGANPYPRATVRRLVGTASVPYFNRLDMHAGQESYKRS